MIIAPILVCSPSLNERHKLAMIWLTVFVRTWSMQMRPVVVKTSPSCCLNPETLEIQMVKRIKVHISPLASLYTPCIIKVIMKRIMKPAS